MPSDKVPTIATKVKNAGKGLIQFGFLVIAFITMWSDFVNIWHVFQSELTVWEKVNGFMFACSLSPNMLSAASALALFNLYQIYTIEFVRTHSRARRQGAEEREVLKSMFEKPCVRCCASMGTMTTIYVAFLLTIYTLPYHGALFLYVAPAVLAYFYITLPMFVCIVVLCAMLRELFSWVSCNI